MFDPVAEAHVAVKELAADDRSGWSAAAKSDRVRGLSVLSERVTGGGGPAVTKFLRRRLR